MDEAGQSAAVRRLFLRPSACPNCLKQALCSPLHSRPWSVLQCLRARSKRAGIACHRLHHQAELFTVLLPKLPPSRSRSSLRTSWAAKSPSHSSGAMPSPVINTSGLLQLSFREPPGGQPSHPQGTIEPKHKHRPCCSCCPQGRPAQCPPICSVLSLHFGRKVDPPKRKPNSLHLTYSCMAGYLANAHAPPVTV